MVVNNHSIASLIEKEITRFCKVPLQTIIAPATMILVLYIVISIAFDTSKANYGSFSYLLFLSPGLIAMSSAQNAFDNNISSIVTAKQQGTLVDILMAPLLPHHIVLSFLVAGLTRGLLVAGITFSLILILNPVTINSYWLLAIYICLGGSMFSLIGILGGIYSDTYDQSKAITNFIIIPITYLSGTFYSINSLPSSMEMIIQFNPVFYFVDGVRYAFIGYSESHQTLGILILVITNVSIWLFCIHALKNGGRIKC